MSGHSLCTVNEQDSTHKYLNEAQNLPNFPLIFRGNHPKMLLQLVISFRWCGIRLLILSAGKAQRVS